ncbi:hypothetical protein CA13_13180 [Planctomycetes bacterium CA13]|uniref:Uncharacterized protein n=1 Tax=Novipirellula herctigrandis TaxID=2527986 RepID=A0A5C5YXU8_9BACT|nr:hypothetical protein CA13_13180 [Planctomycetes bacterium CA13]
MDPAFGSSFLKRFEPFLLAKASRRQPRRLRTPTTTAHGFVAGWGHATQEYQCESIPRSF